MDPLGDLLTTLPIQTGWEISIEPCPNWLFGCIDNPDLQFVNDSGLIRTRTQSDSPEPLLTLITASKRISKLAQSQPPSASPNSVNHSLQVYL